MLRTIRAPRSLPPTRCASAAWYITYVMLVLSAWPAAAEPTFVGDRGEFGNHVGQFDAVTGNAVNAGDTLYVADHHLNRITMFDAAGHTLGVWGSPGSAPGELGVPVALAIDAGGDVYVSEQQNHRIQRFTRGGQLVKVLGSLGSGPGQFLFPAGICLTPSRQLYVADSGNRRVQHFDWSGETPVFVRAFGDSTLLSSPNDVALDANGFVFVTDLQDHRVYKFGPDGAWITSWGGEGGDPGQFFAPFDVLVDGTSVHVSDSLNGRIQVFDLNGQLQYIWPSASFLPGPTRMTLAADRRLYLTAALAVRVLIYQFDPVSTQRTSWSDVKGAYR